MANPAEDQPRTVVGTFADPSYGDRAADAARKSGFEVQRRSDGAVLVDPGPHPQHVAEVEGILRAFGAREFGGPATIATTSSSTTATTGAHDEDAEAGRAEAPAQRHVVAESGATIELVEEELRPRTRPVQTGEVTIRKEVVTETRTIEVPVRREELVIEHHPVDRQPFDRTVRPGADPLVEQLIDRLRHMQTGETLRIPIVEEEIVVHKRPVVVEEISLGKRTVADKQWVTDTVRREEARIEPHGDVHLPEA
jgi:stress response protein YsnF